MPGTDVDIKIETYWNVNQEIKSVVNPTVKLK